MGIVKLVASEGSDRWVDGRWSNRWCVTVGGWSCMMQLCSWWSTKCFVLGRGKLEGERVTTCTPTLSSVSSTWVAVTCEGNEGMVVVLFAWISESEKGTEEAWATEKGKGRVWVCYATKRGGWVQRAEGFAMVDVDFEWEWEKETSYQVRPIGF